MVALAAERSAARAFSVAFTTHSCVGVYCSLLPLLRLPLDEDGEGWCSLLLSLSSSPSPSPMSTTSPDHPSLRRLAANCAPAWLAPTITARSGVTHLAWE